MAVAAWVAVAGAISWGLQTRDGHPFIATLGVSAFSSLFACAAVALIYSSVTDRRQRAALLGGISGVAPSDGPGAVLVGTLEPLGRTLTAPMNGTASVTYSYSVNETRGTGKQRMHYTHFKGVGLAPSVIVTATGSFKLLTVPDLEAAEPDDTAGERMAGFERYAAATTFTPAGTAAQQLLERWADADGEYRSDVAYAALDTVNLTNCQLEQRVVPPGARVCVFGRFSAAKGGIVPSTGMQSPPKLILGSPDQAAARLASTARTRLVLGVLASAVAGGLLAAFIAA